MSPATMRSLVRASACATADGGRRFGVAHVRLLSLASFSPHPLPPDVNPTSGMCADDLVCIQVCGNPAKGLGAFAARHIDAGTIVGHYMGEAISLSEMYFRYEGASRMDTPDEYEEANRRARWMHDRQERGVSITGTYILQAGKTSAGRIVLLDAEDPATANWTRYINHSAKRPNLEVVFPDRATALDEMASDESARDGAGGASGASAVRFVALRSIEAGEELLFNYGEDFDTDVGELLGFEQ